MIKIETSEDPKDKDFGKFFIKLDTSKEFLQLVGYIEKLKNYKIKLRQGNYDESDNCNGKYYLDCTKKQLKKFMKNGFCDRICRNCEKSGKRKEMKVCSRCKISWYCSQKCQKEYWNKHKKFCKKFI